MLLLNCFTFKTKKKINVVRKRQTNLSIRILTLNFKIRFQATYTIELEFRIFYYVKEKQIKC